MRMEPRTVPFFVWLLSHHDVSEAHGCHVVGSLFLLGASAVLCGGASLFPFSVNAHFGHLGRFQFGAISNEAAVSILGRL